MSVSYRIFRNDRKNSKSQQCVGKNRYTLEEARIQAKYARKTGRIKTPRIYECEYCGGWHIARNQPLEKKYRD